MLDATLFLQYVGIDVSHEYPYIVVGLSTTILSRDIE